MTAVISAYERLMAWASTRGFSDRQWLGYMWENPEIVASKDCGDDVAAEVDDMRPKGEIGRFQFHAMRVAEVRIKGASN